jgi:hypothetical protein
MPKRTRNRVQLVKAAKLRWSMKNISIKDHSSDGDSIMDSNEMIVTDNVDNFNWTDKSLMNSIGDLFQVCINGCNLRTLSTLLYMILRHFNFTWRDTDIFLSDIGGMRCITTNKWAQLFINGDLDEIMQEGRGGQRGDSFFDVYPDIEADAKLFVADACSKKAATFKSIDLANFIDSSYRKLTGTKKHQNHLIRSEKMCRLDLQRWGYRFDLNTSRPFYQGHDRTDVLAYRENFLNYFLSKKDHYYLVGDGDYPAWCIPTQQPRIIICKLNYFI